MRPEALLVWVTLTVDQNLLPSGGGLKQLVTEKLIFHIFDVRHKSMFRFLAAAGYERETHPGGWAPAARNVSCELFTSEQKISRIVQI
jgi:hypothetical protein